MISTGQPLPEHQLNALPTAGLEIIFLQLMLVKLCGETTIMDFKLRRIRTTHNGQRTGGVVDLDETLGSPLSHRRELTTVSSAKSVCSQQRRLRWQSRGKT